MSNPSFFRAVSRTALATLAAGFLALSAAAQTGQGGSGGFGYVGGYGAYGSDQWWVAPSDPNVYRGQVSLEVHNARANYVGLAMTGGVTYTLSYWAKTDAATAIGVTFGTTVPGSGTFTDASTAVTAGGYQASSAADTNWHQYFATITPAGSATNFEFGIDCRPASGTWWLDQVKLVVAGSAGPIANLVQDGGFEAAYTTNFNGDANDWPTAGWVNGHWTSEYNWDIFQSGNPTGPTALTIEGTRAIAHTGYSSLLLNNERANYTQLTLTAGVTYDLSYWAQGYPSEIIGVGDLTIDVPGVYPVQITDESSGILSGGYQSYTMTNEAWNEYFAKIKPSITTNLFMFGIDSRPGPTYIDDVTLVAEGSSVNLIRDPSLEAASQNNFPGGDPNGWAATGWIDLLWYSEYNWDIEQYGQPLGSEAMGISGTPAVVHSGNAALEVNYLSPRANYTGLSLTGGTTYTLTYYLYSTEGNAPVGVTFGSTVPGSSTVTDLSTAVTAGGYGSSLTPTIGGGQQDWWASWHQYSATITPASSGTNFEFGIDCRPAGSDFYIDDVVLVAQGTTQNLVQDGSFEASYQNNLNGDGNDWFTANWVDGHWYSQYASAVHIYGNPAGPQALYIQGTPKTPGYAVLPLIVSALRSSLNLNQVTVAYNEQLAASTATNLANYAVNNGNSITSATLDSSGSVVTLLLSNAVANGGNTILTVNGIMDSLGATTIATNTQITIATPSTPPTIVSAVRPLLTPTQVTVTFSEPLQTSSATAATNYTLNNGNSVTGATIDGTLSVVTLTLAHGIANNTAQILTVNGVADSTGGSLIATNTQVTILVPSDLVLAEDPSTNHLVTLEAEDYNLNLPGGGQSWVFTTTPPFLLTTGANTNYSGTGVMVVPDAMKSYSFNPGDHPSNIPELDYLVYFTTTGNFTAWVRGAGDSDAAGGNDSISLGLDGAVAYRINGVFPQSAGYAWGETPTPTGAVFNVPTTGLHVVNAWMREDGFGFDKLVLAGNTNYIPTGVGPAESLATLTVRTSGGASTLLWGATGVLQSSATVNGPYQDVSGATSPYPLTFSGPSKFYRLRN